MTWDVLRCNLPAALRGKRKVNEVAVVRRRACKRTHTRQLIRPLVLSQHDHHPSNIQ